MHDVALGGLQATPLVGFAAGQPGTHPLSESHQRPPSQKPWVNAPQPLFHAQLAYGLEQSEPSFGGDVGHDGGGGGGLGHSL